MRSIMIVAAAVIAVQRAGAQVCHQSSSSEVSRLQVARVSDDVVRMGCDLVGVGVLTVSPTIGSRVHVAFTHELDGAGHAMGVVNELVGTVRRFDHDTLVVGRNGGEIALNVAYIIRMQLVEGKTTAALPVAIGGAIGGGLIGLVAGNVAACGLIGFHGCVDEASHERQGLVAGGFVGAALGAAIGSLFRLDHWVDVPISVFNPTLRPANTSFAVKFHATF